MSILGFKKKSESVDVVTDLDSILEKPVGFIFKGRTYVIRPLSTLSFFKAMNAVARLDSLRTSDRVKSTDELIDAYAEFFSVICPELTRDIIESMHYQQIAALLTFAIETIMGKQQVELEKKKKLERAPMDEEQKEA